MIGRISFLFRYPELHLIKYRAQCLLYVKKKKYEQWFPKFAHLFSNKLGLEIGGPSDFFRDSIMPIYSTASSIDGCNYSNETVWENKISSAFYRYSGSKEGKQFIIDGTNLQSIPSASYDFVLSCHSLEHIANPLKALQEWKRVIKKGGALLIIVPKKEFTFDRNRQVTDFQHIVEDYERNIDESDLTHLEEIVQLHDLRLDPPLLGSAENLRDRCYKNLENRCMHHHVFDPALLEKLLLYIGMNNINQHFTPPYHQIIIATK